MKNTLSNIFLIASMCCCIFGCDKTDCWRTYSFSIPLSVSPLQDTISIGDTLWLTSDIPEKLTDLSTGELVKIADFDFKVQSIINKMDTLLATQEGLYAANDFGYVNETGSFEVINFSGLSKIEVHLAQAGNGQSLKIGMIPTKKGMFQIVFYNLSKDMQKVGINHSECFENLQVSYAMNGNIDDNNYHYLEHSPVPINSPDGFMNEGGYVFIVK